MGKKSENTQKGKCTNWMQNMQEKYPLSTNHLLSMLKNNNFESFGHAVSQLNQSFEVIETFLDENLVLIIKEDALKDHGAFMQAVETALERSEKQLSEMAL
jgi:hypothetical protein